MRRFGFASLIEDIDAFRRVVDPLASANRNLLGLGDPLLEVLRGQPRIDELARSALEQQFRARSYSLFGPDPLRLRQMAETFQSMATRGDLSSLFESQKLHVHDYLIPDLPSLPILYELSEKPHSEAVLLIQHIQDEVDVLTAEIEGNPRKTVVIEIDLPNGVQMWARVIKALTDHTLRIEGRNSASKEDMVTNVGVASLVWSVITLDIEPPPLRAVPPTP